MTEQRNRVLQLWKRLFSKPGGCWLFSRLVSLQAPYFATIRPLFVALEPRRAEATMRKRRAVHNHIATATPQTTPDWREDTGYPVEVTVTDTQGHRRVSCGHHHVGYRQKALTDLPAPGPSRQDGNQRITSFPPTRIPIARQASHAGAGPNL